MSPLVKSDPLVLSNCPSCGKTAAIGRGEDGRLHCADCGEGEQALVAHATGRMHISEVPLSELVAELERRTQSAPDLGLSEQVCPRCSSVTDEVLGSWSRKEQRFRCGGCGANLYGDRYERETEKYRRNLWKARGERLRIRKLLKAHR